jgi:hypothetical protein
MSFGADVWGNGGRGRGPTQGDLFWQSMQRAQEFTDSRFNNYAHAVNAGLGIGEVLFKCAANPWERAPIRGKK